MEVVAAGVAVPRRAALKRQTALLGHGQRVKVGPQQQHRTAVPELRPDARPADLRLHAQLPQALQKVGPRQRHVQPHLRRLMKIPPVPHQLVPQRLCA